MAKRTGLRTLGMIVAKLCKLFAVWLPAILLIVPQDKHVYVLALEQACSDFMANVDVGDILNDETP